MARLGQRRASRGARRRNNKVGRELLLQLQLELAQAADMKRNRGNPWFGIGIDAWRLGLEASTVIGLRTLKIAQGGPGGRAEAERMVSEKIDAGLSLQGKALSGRLGQTPASASARTLAHYRRKVSANRRRLTKT